MPLAGLSHAVFAYKGMEKNILSLFLGRSRQDEFLFFQAGIPGTREERVNLVLVFGPVHGACGICQQAARPECRPYRIQQFPLQPRRRFQFCLLYTSDAADEH